MIPESRIEEVRESVDMEAVLRSSGLTLKKRGEHDFLASCPFHDDKTPSFSVDTKRKIYHCFGCGAKGNVFQFVQEIQNITFPEAVEYLANFSGLAPLTNLSKPKPSSLATKNNNMATPSNRTQTLTAAFHQMQRSYTTSFPAQNYLVETRGLSNITSFKNLEIGYCPKDFSQSLDPQLKKSLLEIGLLSSNGSKVHLSDCLVFPLKDTSGNILSLYGRKITPSRVKATSSRINGKHYYLPGDRKGVYGFSNPESDHVYLVESVLDALTLYHLGETSVLALHGTNGFTDSHKKWLAQNKISTVYLLLDADEAGQTASAKLYNTLFDTYEVEILSLPDGEDPNSHFKIYPTLKALKNLHQSPQDTENTNSNKNVSNTKNAAKNTLIPEGEGYTYTCGPNKNPRKYTIPELSLQSHSKLKITLKLQLSSNSKGSGEDIFYSDGLDLYLARSRSGYIENLVAEIPSLEESTIRSDLKTLSSLLEKERAKLLAPDSEPKEKDPRESMSKKDQEQAIKDLKHPTLIPQMLIDLENMGIMGDEKAKAICAVGTVSRFLDTPLGILIVSRSGAGKTMLQNTVCDLVNPEHLAKYTRISGTTLFYQDENALKRKVLAIEEEDGMKDALYSIRTLQSSQKLTVSTTGSDPKTGKLKAEEYSVQGPVFIIIATTNPDALDPETRSRFIIVTIDESSEQTKTIQNARRKKYTLEGQIQDSVKDEVLSKYQNMQRMLRPIRVSNPWAEVLEYPFDRLSMRRDFDKYMLLINSIALFHQYQRPILKAKKNGRIIEYIEVTLTDIALANELALHFFPYSTDDMAPHTRNFAKEISKYKKEHGTKFTRKEIRDFTGWGDWSVRQALEQLVELGYLNKTGQNGIATRYELLVDASEEERNTFFLTDVSKLKERLEELKTRRNKDAA